MSRRRSYRNLIETELETMPLMGLFVVLIPMLLLSAVFLQISVIDLNLPEEAAAELDRQRKQLALTVEIADEAFIVSAKGVGSRTIPRAGEDARERLLGELAGIHEKHPQNQAVTIVSRARTRYEDIILVMDVSREAGLPHASLLGKEL
jgi:biopolymer transport protein ExbD